MDCLLLSYAFLALGCIFLAAIKKEKGKLIFFVAAEIVLLFLLFAGVPEETKRFYPPFWVTNVLTWLMLIAVYIVHVRKSRTG